MCRMVMWGCVSSWPGAATCCLSQHAKQSCHGTHAHQLRCSPRWGIYQRFLGIVTHAPDVLHPGRPRCSCRGRFGGSRAAVQSSSAHRHSCCLLLRRTRAPDQQLRGSPTPYACAIRDYPSVLENSLTPDELVPGRSAHASVEAPCLKIGVTVRSLPIPL